MPAASGGGPQCGAQLPQGQPQSVGSGRVTLTLSFSEDSVGEGPRRGSRARRPPHPSTEHADNTQVPCGGRRGPGSPRWGPLVEAEPVAPEAAGSPAGSFPPFLEGGRQPRASVWPPPGYVCARLWLRTRSGVRGAGDPWGEHHPAGRPAWGEVLGWASVPLRIPKSVVARQGMRPHPSFSTHPTGHFLEHPLRDTHLPWEC